MADEKEPHPDPSEPNDHEATNDAPESDAETRMLQQIAALDNGTEGRGAVQPASLDPEEQDEAVVASDEHETEQTRVYCPAAAGASGGGGSIWDHGEHMPSEAL